MYVRKSGPAILIQDVSTVVVEPGCTATVSPFGDVAIDVGDIGDVARGEGGGGDGGNSSGGRKRVKRELDPVYLSIFAHRFMGIAEQMGRTLQVCMWLVFCVRGGGAFQAHCRPWGAAFAWAGLSRRQQWWYPRVVCAVERAACLTDSLHTERKALCSPACTCAVSRPTAVAPILSSRCWAVVGGCCFLSSFLLVVVVVVVVVKGCIYLSPLKTSVPILSHP